MTLSSPAVTLYDANGVAMAVQNGAVVGSTSSLVVAGSDGTNFRNLLTHTDGSVRQLPSSQRTIVHNNATLTTSGSTIVTGLGMSEWYLIVNLKNAPTGTTPTIAFKLEALDPIDQATVIDATTTETGVTHTTAGTEALQLADNITDTVKISWTITGAGASWTGVNVSWSGHIAGNAIEGQADEGAPLMEGPVPVAGIDVSRNVHTLKVAADGSLIVSPTGTDKTNGSRAGFVVLGGGTSGTFNAIRGTVYTEQATNAQRSVSSSSASDAAAGTGARVVTITYYDQTGAGPFSEDVTLNGVTSVATVSSTICFIESMTVKTVGSNGSNVGTISLFVNNAGGGGTIGSIAVSTLVSGVGDNRTLWAHHYVPPSGSCNVTAIIAGATASTTFLLRTKNPTSANSPDEITSAGVFTTAAEFIRSFGSPLIVPGPSRITLYGIPSTNGVTINGAFDFFE